MTPQFLLRVELLSQEMEKAADGGGYRSSAMSSWERAIRPPPRDAKDLDAEVLSSGEGLNCR